MNTTEARSNQQNEVATDSRTPSYAAPEIHELGNASDLTLGYVNGWFSEGAGWYC